MSRRKLIALLDYLVRERVLTRQAGKRLLKLYDDGELEQELLDLLDRANTSRNRSSTAAVADASMGYATVIGLIAVYAVYGARGTEKKPMGVGAMAEIRGAILTNARTFVTASYTPGVAVPGLVRSFGVRLPLIGATNRIRATNQLLDGYRQQARALARTYAGQSTDSWLYTSSVAVRDHHHAQALLGNGGPLSFAQRRRLDREVREQLRYLRRFGAEIDARQVAAQTGLLDKKGRLIKPLSEKQIGARLAQYGGAGTSAFYRYSEDGLDVGWVVDYFAVDDRGTCQPCLTAQAAGPYLPGQGPMPGADVCDGGGACRCERRPSFSPDRYADLVGRPAVAVV